MSDHKPKPTDYKAEAMKLHAEMFYDTLPDKFDHTDCRTCGLLVALLERLCGEARGKGRACEVCWNSAWVPVPPEYAAEFDETVTMADALKIRCDFCWRVGLSAQLKAQLAEAQKEIERLTTCGVVEVMYSNPNVDAWVKEHEMRLHKAESAIEQAREEGFRQCDGQWQMAVGFAITGMEREKVIAQVRDEGRREQREKDAQLAGLNCWPLDGRQTQDDIVRRIREAKP